MVQENLVTELVLFLPSQDLPFPDLKLQTPSLSLAQGDIEAPGVWQPLKSHIFVERM